SPRPKPLPAENMRPVRGIPSVPRQAATFISKGETARRTRAARRAVRGQEGRDDDLALPVRAHRRPLRRATPGRRLRPRRLPPRPPGTAVAGRLLGRTVGLTAAGLATGPVRAVAGLPCRARLGLARARAPGRPGRRRAAALARLPPPAPPV